LRTTPNTTFDPWCFLLPNSKNRELSDILDIINNYAIINTQQAHTWHSTSGIRLGYNLRYAGVEKYRLWAEMLTQPDCKAL
jgi:hypothetical protein